MTRSQKIIKKISGLIEQIKILPMKDQIEIVNSVSKILHIAGPFKNEPVGCIQWIKNDDVQANDYNPNIVAPPEMDLLKHSIEMDGYTQPIVVWRNANHFEVVDGFHRNRVGKECKHISKRLCGYLPVTIIKSDREDRGDRIAATIRHNRARGKHTVEGMSEIVIELKRRNWSEKKIGRELGMDPDEVLRLCQISGLAEMFSDHEFSKAWEADECTIDEIDNLNTTEENVKI